MNNMFLARFLLQSRAFTTAIGYTSLHPFLH